MTNRRELVLWLGCAVAAPRVLRAQQKVIPVIGYLSSQSAEALAPILPAFRDGLKEAGYIEGRNFSFEFAWAAGQYDKLPALAEDLVRSPSSSRPEVLSPHLRPRLQPRPSRLSSRSATTQSNTALWAVSTTPVATSRVSRCSWPR